MPHDLTLCSHCSRHVRADASRCPFCDATVTAPELRELPAGLSRRALVALGATLALADCRSSTRGDDTSIVQPYGAPIIRTPDVPLIVAPYGAPPEPRRSTDPLVATDVTWELSATAATVSLDRIGSWRLRIAARNHGTTAHDPGRGAVTFLVNGRPSLPTTLAFSNGAMTPEWSSLPPGATAHDEREIGPAIFRTPGDYEITLQFQGVTAATTRVRVTQ